MPERPNSRERFRLFASGRGGKKPERFYLSVFICWIVKDPAKHAEPREKADPPTPIASTGPGRYLY
jgi:hypothetical protein